MAGEFDVGSSVAEFEAVNVLVVESGRGSFLNGDN
jgi:hypothetical protein